jgi:hypothetical protein
MYSHCMKWHSKCYMACLLWWLHPQSSWWHLDPDHYSLLQATAGLTFRRSSCNDFGPKSFVHCSPSHGIVPISFADHVISLWEYTKLDVHSIFNLQLPGFPRFKNKRFYWAGLTLEPFVLSVYWLYTLKQISFHAMPTCPFLLKHEDSHKHCILQLFHSII